MSKDSSVKYYPDNKEKGLVKISKSFQRKKFKKATKRVWVILKFFWRWKTKVGLVEKKILQEEKSALL